MKIFVENESDKERAFALKKIINNNIDIIYENKINTDKTKGRPKQDKIEGKLRFENCNQLVISPYTSNIKFKKFLKFIDIKSEGIRRRLNFLNIKFFLSKILKIIRNLNFIPHSKTIIINRGFDLKPVFPTMEQIIKGRYIAYGKFDKSIAELYGIKVEATLGYYNYDLTNSEFKDSVLFKPSYFSYINNDKRISNLFLKLSKQTINRKKNLNKFSFHPDCKEWNEAYKIAQKNNWTQIIRDNKNAMSEASIVICDITSTFFVSLYLRKKIYLIDRDFKKGFHPKMRKIIKKYLPLIPTVEEIINLNTNSYPKSSKKALSEIREILF